jgi:hypothetical protein
MSEGKFGITPFARATSSIEHVVVVLILVVVLVIRVRLWARMHE